MRVLVINSGSSSIKFHLYEMQSEILLASGTLERIAETDSKLVIRQHLARGRIQVQKENVAISDHAAGFKKIAAFLAENHSSNGIASLQAIGHRVVHGGEAFRMPAIVDDHVINTIRSMIPLAPIHNPINLGGIEIMRQIYPDVPQVAVFDTGFFQDLPPRAYRYAIPEKLYLDHHIRRYGFHGTSHQHVAAKAADYLAQPLEKLKLITLHLGNGSSAAAILGGVCVDTSMGMTPLEGLVMGSRCGDLDPAVHFYLAKKLGMDFDEIENLLNHDSGIKGLCGVSDMREVHQLARQGNQHAALAIEVYCYRICKYIGAYSVILGGLDALVFTGGIGENDPLIRQIICDQLSVLRISLDHEKNQRCNTVPFDISDKKGSIKVLVIATNEELEIARQTVNILTKTGVT